MATYAGIDLHSSNNYIGVINSKDKRLYGKRHDNNIKQVVKALRPFRKNLKGVVVESTYNWYWLVDGLQEAGFKVHLANPAAIQPYTGLKYTDDKWDSYWLAHLLRLKLLKSGYIYPKKERPVRDLLRRRLMFVKQRTTQILSLQSMITRHRGINYPGSSIKTFKDQFIERLFDDPYLVLLGKKEMSTIRHLGAVINEIESAVSAKISLQKEYQMLLTTPGIGQVLGLTIMLEVGNIRRFKEAGNYSSYCRCVESKRISNGKKKGANNKKNGNRHLAWAYVEAAHHASRCNQRAQRFFQRKMSKSNRTLATKALANKLTKATYYIMRDQVPFDSEKLFR
ncbi:MAG: IS110 family transposase [Desulfobacterales bacterium]|nr:IS110 family transposase [Desulfobacterales bacterium]